MNAVTLSFNGVDFRLVHDTQGSNGELETKQITIMPDGQNGDFQAIKLNSFTGSLVISPSIVPSLNSDLIIGSTPMVPAAGVQQNFGENIAAVVDEGPPTPSEKDKISDDELPSGQTQLSFGTSKKPLPSKDKRKGKRGHSKLKKKRKVASKSSPSMGSETVPTLGQATQLTESDESDQRTCLKPEAVLETASNIIPLQTKLKSQSQIESDGDPSFGDGSFSNSKNIENSSDNTIKEFDSDIMTELDATECSVSPGPVKISNPNVPCPRWGQTMTVINDSRILIYGGQAFDSETGALKTLTDLHVYDTVKKTWSKPINCEGMPRMWHSATYLPERSLLISFGGEGYNSKTKKVVTTDQVMVLDTEIMLWYPPSVSGAVPTGRSGHTASLLPNSNELVIFGGVKNNKWQNSMAVLDTMRWKWSLPKVTGDPPRPRSYHTATAVNRPGRSGDLLVIFGGNNGDESFNSVHVLNATFEGKWQWFNPEVKGVAPSPRTGHIATLLDDSKTILIQGGWDPLSDDDASVESDGIFGDSFLLDTEKWTWSPGPKPKFQRNQFGVQDGGDKRTGASSILVSLDNSEQVLSFGGRIPGDAFACDFQIFPELTLA